MTTILTGNPGRLSAGKFLQVLPLGEPGAHWRHLSVVTIVRWFRRPTERRAHRRVQALARLPQSAHIQVERRRLQRHHGWERPRMRYAWVQRECFFAHPGLAYVWL